MTDPIDPQEIREDNREGRAAFREGRADTREGSASRRDDRADDRESEAALRDVRADDRDDRAGVRDGSADVRETSAVDREVDAVEREGRAVTRETIAVGRDGTLHRLVSVLIALTFVLCVLSVVSTLRSFVVQDAVEHVEEVDADQTRTAEETNKVARDTLAELRLAVPDEGDTTTTDAVAAIHRMEGYLCGGPCPPTE